MNKKRKNTAALPAAGLLIIDTQMARQAMDTDIPAPEAMNNGFRPKRSTVIKANEAAKIFHVSTQAANRDASWLGKPRDSLKMVVA